MSEKKEEESKKIIVQHSSREILNALRAAILDNFPRVWILHYFNTVAPEERRLEIETVWAGALPKSKFDEIKLFSEKFLLDYKKTT